MEAQGRLFGFRSGKRWRKACTVLAVGTTAVLFALTPLPFVFATNQDVLLYKGIRLLLFSAPILCWLLLSDYPLCKRVPFFSSAQRGTRALGALTLTAFLVCASVNLFNLHTAEYRASVQTAVAHLVMPDAAAQQEKPKPAAESEPQPKPTDEVQGTDEKTPQNDGVLGSALAERREGCGTD